MISVTTLPGCSALSGDGDCTTTVPGLSPGWAGRYWKRICRPDPFAMELALRLLDAVKSGTETRSDSHGPIVIGARACDQTTTWAYLQPGGTRSSVRGSTETGMEATPTGGAQSSRGRPRMAFVMYWFQISAGKVPPKTGDPAYCVRIGRAGFS